MITRVGEGFDAISDLVPGFGDHFTAVGQANADGRDRFALARYDRRGKPDPSFGDMGSVVVPTSAPYAYGAAGAQLPDGRVVAVGASGNNSATENLRFSGTAVGFSGGATAPWLRPVGASYSYANAVVALADGRVLSAGVATERLGNPAMALMRTSPTGVLDRTWDGDGLATARAGDGTVASDLVLDAEGRAVAAGDATIGADHAFAVARFDGAGALDRSFGGGVVLTSFPGTSRARATAIARQADGKLVVAGIACSSGSGAQCTGGTARLALARYLAAPAAAPPPGGGTQPPVTKKKFVTLPARLTVHRGVVRVKRPLRAGQALQGEALAAAAAQGPQGAAAGLQDRDGEGAAHPHDRRQGAAQAARPPPHVAGADGVRGPRRDRRAPQDHQERDAEAPLSHGGPASA